MGNKRKLYVGILALAVIAFVADRMLYDGEELEPAQATAALRSRGGDRSEPKPRMQPIVAVAAADPLGPGLAQRLERRCHRSDPQSGDALRDAFAPSQIWKPAQAQAEAERPDADVQTLQEFGRTHTLTAVISGAQGAAILDDRVVRIGQTIAGCTLVAVEGDSALFQAGQKKLLLRVPQ